MEEFQGVAYLSVSYIETQYTWVTLPTSLVLLTLIFLLVTITKSRRLGVKNWRSSSFATLQGLHTGIHSDLGGLKSLGLMEEKVDDMLVILDAKVSMRQSGNRWRLVKMD